MMLKSYHRAHQLCHESCFFQLHDCSMILQRESAQRLMIFFVKFSFWFALEFNQHWATIMLFKVCKIISTLKLIWARKDDECWVIEQSKSSIFSHSFAESNLRLFHDFWIVEVISVDSIIAVRESTALKRV